MNKPTIIDYFRNITFIVFIISLILGCLFYFKFLIFTIPYLVMEVCAILHRWLRFSARQISKHGSSRQLKYIIFMDQHLIDLKFVAFFRRIFLVLSIGVLVKVFVGGYEKYLWIPIMLVLLNIITFIKGWYIFRTYVEGSYTSFYTYKNQISKDFLYPIQCIKDIKDHKKGAVFGLIGFILLIGLTVYFVLYL